MRKIREVLRLAFGAGLELRKIERSLGISHATVSSYVARARAADLSWPLPESLGRCDAGPAVVPQAFAVGRYPPVAGLGVHPQRASS